RRDISRQTIEANDRTAPSRTSARHHRVERALTAGVAALLRAPQQLLRRQLGLLREPLPDVIREPLGLRRPTDAPSPSLGRIIDMLDRRLAADALHRGERNARALGDRRQRQVYRK